MKNEKFYNALVKANNWLDDKLEKMHKDGKDYIGADILVYMCVKYYVLRQNKIIDKVAMITILENTKLWTEYGELVKLPFDTDLDLDHLSEKYRENKKRFNRHDKFIYHTVFKSFYIYTGTYRGHNRSIFSVLQ